MCVCLGVCVCAVILTNEFIYLFPFVVLLLFQIVTEECDLQFGVFDS